jgi:hypothetical protein
MEKVDLNVGISIDVVGWAGLNLTRTFFEKEKDAAPKIRREDGYAGQARNTPRTVSSRKARGM